MKAAACGDHPGVNRIRYSALKFYWLCRRAVTVSEETVSAARTDAWLRTRYEKDCRALLWPVSLGTIVPSLDRGIDGVLLHHYWSMPHQIAISLPKEKAEIASAKTHFEKKNSAMKYFAASLKFATSSIWILKQSSWPS